MNGFSEMLSYLRKRENLSQRELAKKLHVSASTIGMYESGKRYPSREQEEEIADFFNVNIDTLRGKVSVEKNKETASIIVEMTKDARYMEYYKKIRELTQQDKQNICNYIDYIVFNAKNNL